MWGFGTLTRMAGNLWSNKKDPSMSTMDKIMFQPYTDHDAKLTLEELAEREGIKTEKHIVITEDGYHLTVYHLQTPGLKPGSPVAFMQHGLFSSADTWISRQSLSPAVRAAKAGYDVWLGNNRGTKYAREHNTLKATNDYSKYFDYSYFELGKFDAPAQIDFVRHKTGQDKVTWIGHS